MTAETVRSSASASFSQELGKAESRNDIIGLCRWKKLLTQNNLCIYDLTLKNRMLCRLDSKTESINGCSFSKVYLHYLSIPEQNCHPLWILDGVGEFFNAYNIKESEVTRTRELYRLLYGFDNTWNPLMVDGNEWLFDRFEVYDMKSGQYLRYCVSSFHQILFRKLSETYNNKNMVVYGSWGMDFVFAKPPRTNLAGSEFSAHIGEYNLIKREQYLEMITC
jgi:hypothetical protein